MFVIRSVCQHLFRISSFGSSTRLIFKTHCCVVEAQLQSQIKMSYEFILSFSFDLKRTFLFLIGLTIGSLIFLMTISSLKVLVADQSKLSNEVKVLYDDNLADDLFQKVKVLCMIHTFPANHKTKAIHIKNTWGKRCNKLLFVTSEEDPDLDILHIPVAESRDVLKYKTKESFLYAHDNYLDDFDWFIKADDDK